jgi:cation diffusion facilitator CzcD-associated flavoprotein CzcO
MPAGSSRSWGPDAKPALDVLIVGAGQSGIATAFGLMRSQVTNFLILDMAEEGQEGPWLSYARMHTLRSPKHFTGPDLDIPSLTYQSWHEARFGTEHWQNLALIPRRLWAEYLLWFRHVVGVSVRNGCELLEIAFARDGLLAAIVQRAGVVETLYARKIVLTTGQEATRNWTIPEPLRRLPISVVACASDPIDFAALAGRKVAVIGAGATAFDNAATALEAGAAEVHLLCRGAEIQVIQPHRWLTFCGFSLRRAGMTGVWDIVWRVICLKYRLKVSLDPEPFLGQVSLLNSGD